MLKIPPLTIGPKKCRDFISDTSGNIAVFMAIAMLPVLLTAGLAIEWRQITNTHADVQELLDASVLNAAVDFSDTNDFSAVTDHFKTNVQTKTSFLTTYSITESDGSIFGTASVFVPGTFSSFFGHEGFNIQLRSTASVNPVGSGVSCITTLDPTQNQSFILNSGAQIIAPDCTVQVHSQANQAAIFNSGITLDTNGVCIAGSNVINNSRLSEGTDFTLNCDVSPDPLAGMIQAPLFSSCNGHSRFVSGPTTLQPGVYCGGLIFNGGPDVTFEPGVYIIRNGTWLVNGGSWEGEGVTFYFEDNSIIQFNSNVDIDLSAPSNGPYKDILFTEAPNLPESNFTLNDTNAFDISGAIYLPSRNMTINSNGNAKAFDLILVVNNLIMNNAQWELSSDIAANFGGSTATQVALIQ